MSKVTSTCFGFLGLSLAHLQNSSAPKEGSPGCQLPLPVPPVSCSLVPNIGYAMRTILDMSDFKPGATHSNQKCKRPFVKYLQVLGCNSRGRGDTLDTDMRRTRNFFMLVVNEAVKDNEYSRQSLAPGLNFTPYLHLLSRFERKRKVPFWCGDH